MKNLSRINFKDSISFDKVIIKYMPFSANCALPARRGAFGIMNWEKVLSCCRFFTHSFNLPVSIICDRCENRKVGRRTCWSSSTKRRTIRVWSAKRTSKRSSRQARARADGAGSSFVLRTAERFWEPFRELSNQYGRPSDWGWSFRIATTKNWPYPTPSVQVCEGKARSGRFLAKEYLDYELNNEGVSLPADRYKFEERELPVDQIQALGLNKEILLENQSMGDILKGRIQQTGYR